MNVTTRQLFGMTVGHVAALATITGTGAVGTAQA